MRVAPLGAAPRTLQIVRRRPAALWIGALVLPLLATSCAVESQNLQASRELMRRSQTAGSVYAGWRLYQDRCAECHGRDGSGGVGPDLRLQLRDMGARRFVSLVLHRYDWNLPAAQAGADEAVVDELLRRRADAVVMPAWHGEPVVEAHIVDLFAYLSARANGSLGPDRPGR